MYKLTLTLIALVLTPVLALAQERVGDFALIDQNGYHHNMSYLDDHEAVAFWCRLTVARQLNRRYPGFLRCENSLTPEASSF